MGEAVMVRGTAKGAGISVPGHFARSWYFGALSPILIPVGSSSVHLVVDGRRFQYPRPDHPGQRASSVSVSRELLPVPAKSVQLWLGLCRSTRCRLLRAAQIISQWRQRRRRVRPRRGAISGPHPLSWDRSFKHDPGWSGFHRLPVQAPRRPSLLIRRASAHGCCQEVKGDGTQHLQRAFGSLPPPSCGGSDARLSSAAASSDRATPAVCRLSSKVTSCPGS